MKKIIILFLITILNSFFGFCQTGEIHGKLILEDLENYQVVLKNTMIILKSKTRNDTIKVDKNLEFKFKNLSTDTLNVFILPRNYPTNTYYRVNLKEGEIQKLELKYSSVCPYSKTQNTICPICKKDDKVISITYGFVASVKFRDKDGEITDKNGKPILEERKVKYGGCVVTDCHPNWFCTRDEMEF
ncbi:MULTISPECIES: hypothetical protein [Flavobacterium]|uniref:Uncharacterized protein n=1 Tax=Flavobacterium jumunjinense TaxID=998845 RepID=A0ABV5GII6_9FLAO|nr:MULTISPECIES: hypothetical protein [Flavobacterium]